MANQTYNIIDSGHGKKLEQVGPYKILRPAAGAVWNPQLPKSVWHDADAVFERHSGGDGKWMVRNRKLPAQWDIEVSGISFKMQRTDFGHLGIFPEQAQNWQKLGRLIKDANVDEFRVLNLFAYTGGSTLACALAGAKVTHVDASKTSVSWARENAELCSKDPLPIRWIVDDVQKYISREIKRGSRYHGIILDPPTYGRGTKNEVWKIETHTMPLLENLAKLLDDDFKFVLLSSHSQGYTPVALENMLKQVIKGPAEFCSGEMILPGNAKAYRLPSGASTLLIRPD